MSADPKEVGAQIRALLFSLGPVYVDCSSYSADEARRKALEYAGICWLAPGEMAPQCCCEWSIESPEVPRKELQRRISSNRENT